MNSKMGRILRKIFVENKKVNALFDSGSERSYIAKHVLPKDSVCKKITSFEVGLGGRIRVIREQCLLEPKINGLRFSFSPYLTDNLGDIKEGRVDVIIGATTMEEWDMTLNPKNKIVDLEGLKKREFTEF